VVGVGKKIRGRGRKIFGVRVGRFASYSQVVEHFLRRGTFFHEKKDLTLFFLPLFCALFSWNILRSVEHFGVPTSFF
jgi:hypothetical protein